MDSFYSVINFKDEQLLIQKGMIKSQTKWNVSIGMGAGAVANKEQGIRPGFSAGIYVGRTILKF